METSWSEFFLYIRGVIYSIYICKSESPDYILTYIIFKKDNMYTYKMIEKIDKLIVNDNI